MNTIMHDALADDTCEPMDSPKKILDALQHWTKALVIGSDPARAFRAIGGICRDLLNIFSSSDNRLCEQLDPVALSVSTIQLHQAMHHPKIVSYLQGYTSSDIDVLQMYYDCFCKSNRYIQELYYTSSNSDWASLERMNIQFHSWTRPIVAGWWAHPLLIGDLEARLQAHEDALNTGTMIDLHSSMETLLMQEQTWVQVFRRPDTYACGLIHTLLHELACDSAAPSSSGIPLLDVWRAEFDAARQISPVLMDTLLHVLQYYWKTDVDFSTHFHSLLSIATPACPEYVRLCASLDQWALLQDMLLQDYGYKDGVLLLESSCELSLNDE